MRFIYRIFGWCWHEWGNWGMIETTTKLIVDDGKPHYIKIGPLQKRYCRLCGQKDIRGVSCH